MSIEEQYDDVRQLITSGKEKGDLLSDEINELLPSEITSSDELDELFNTSQRGHRDHRLGAFGGAIERFLVPQVLLQTSERTGSGEMVQGPYTSDPDAETLTCAAPGVEPMDGLDFTD